MSGRFVRILFGAKNGRVPFISGVVRRPYSSSIAKRDNVDEGAVKNTEKPAQHPEVIRVHDKIGVQKNQPPPKPKEFKNYFAGEERDISIIKKHEQFFDKYAPEKTKESFHNAIEVFNSKNSQKNLYLDFVYAAILKMKEFNAHRDLDTYKKLLTLFPVGPYVAKNAWQYDNSYHPRQEACVLHLLEALENNKVYPDEDIARQIIDIFGDWTQPVRKIKRQLYWMPKFRHRNPYPVPTLVELETIHGIDLAKIALERMCVTADHETKIIVNYSSDLEKDDEDTWFLTAQSIKQRELLEAHDPNAPVFVEGPRLVYVGDRSVEYFVMKTDPLPSTQVKLEAIRKYNEYDYKKPMRNMFADPFGKKIPSDELELSKLSVHEQVEGIYFACFVTGTGTQNSVYNWTRLMQASNSAFKDMLIVYRVKDKPRSVSKTGDNYY